MVVNWIWEAFPLATRIRLRHHRSGQSLRSFLASQIRQFRRESLTLRRPWGPSRSTAGLDRELSEAGPYEKCVARMVRGKSTILINRTQPMADNAEMLHGIEFVQVLIAASLKFLGR